MAELAHSWHTGARQSKEIKPRRKVKRGGAKRDQQLSKLQRRILVWLNAREPFDHDYWAKTTGSLKEAKAFKQKGVPWTAKRFYGDAPTPAQERSLSRALARLEKRGLVIRFDTAGGFGAKPRTSHVKLTQAGRDAAAFEKKHGKTARQRQEIKRLDAKRKRLWQLRARRKEVAYWQEMSKRGKVDINVAFEPGTLRPLDVIIDHRNGEAREVEILEVELSAIDAEIRFLEDSLAAHPDEYFPGNDRDGSEIG